MVHQIAFTKLIENESNMIWRNSGEMLASDILLEGLGILSKIMNLNLLNVSSNHEYY